MNGDSKARMFKAIRMHFFFFFYCFVIFLSSFYDFILIINNDIEGIEFPSVAMPIDEPIPPPNSFAPFANIPVFLGPDGTLYDVNCIF